MKGILQVAAWLSLAGGVVAAVTSFSILVDLGVGTAFGVAVGYLFLGFLSWALLLVTVQIAERLERIENSVYQMQQGSETKGTKRD